MPPAERDPAAPRAPEPGPLPADPASTVTVLLADAGGRELGGLPIEVVVPGAPPVVGRIGHPIALPPGELQLRLPTTPPQTRALSLAPGESRSLDLGRLGAVIVRLRRGLERRFVGAPCRFEAEGGALVPGRVGDEALLWPGPYTLTLALPGGRILTRRITAEAGRLLEVELGEGPGARRLRDLADEFRGAARTLLRRGGVASPAASDTRRLFRIAPIRLAGTLIHHVGPRRRGVATPSSGRLVAEAPRFASLRGYPQQTPRGGGFQVLDAGGRRLGGPATLGGAPFWLGEKGPTGPGQLVVPGIQGEGPWLLGGDLDHIFNVGALEVHLKDPEGVSLRGAPLRVLDPGGAEVALGEVGRRIDLWPGTYRLSLPTLPGFEREVVIPGGALTQIDLGLAHQITVEAEGGRPAGAAVAFWREDAPAESPPLVFGAVGVERLLPGGRFRVEVEGEEGRIIASRRRRKRWPTVAPRFLGEEAESGAP